MKKSELLLLIFFGLFFFQQKNLIFFQVSDVSANQICTKIIVQPGEAIESNAFTSKEACLSCGGVPNGTYACETFSQCILCTNGQKQNVDSIYCNEQPCGADRNFCTTFNGRVSNNSIAWYDPNQTICAKCVNGVMRATGISTSDCQEQSPTPTPTRAPTSSPTPVHSATTTPTRVPTNRVFPSPIRNNPIIDDLAIVTRTITPTLTISQSPRNINNTPTPTQSPRSSYECNPNQDHRLPGQSGKPGDKCCGGGVQECNSGICSGGIGKYGACLGTTPTNPGIVVPPPVVSGGSGSPFSGEYAIGDNGNGIPRDFNQSGHTGVDFVPWCNGGPCPKIVVGNGVTYIDRPFSLPCNSTGSSSNSATCFVNHNNHQLGLYHCHIINNYCYPSSGEGRGSSWEHIHLEACSGTMSAGQGSPFVCNGQKVDPCTLFNCNVPIQHNDFNNKDNPDDIENEPNL